MVKIFAQEDFKGPDGRMVKRGEEVCQIPKIYTLQQIVSLATLGQIADHEPAPVKETAKDTAPAGATGAATGPGDGKKSTK